MGEGEQQLCRLEEVYQSERSSWAVLTKSIVSSLKASRSLECVCGAAHSILSSDCLYGYYVPLKCGLLPPEPLISLYWLSLAVDRPTRIKVTHTNHPVTWGAKRNPDNRPYSLSIKSISRPINFYRRSYSFISGSLYYFYMWGMLMWVRVCRR